MAFFRVCFILLLCLSGLIVRAQTGDSAPPRAPLADTGRHRVAVPAPPLDSGALAAPRDSVRRRRIFRDSLAARARRDSVALAVRDSVRRDSSRLDSLRVDSVRLPGARVGRG